MRRLGVPSETPRLVLAPERAKAEISASSSVGRRPPSKCRSYPFRHFVEAGGLIDIRRALARATEACRGPNRRSVRGTPVGSIPYYQSTRFSLILNLKAAAASQLTIPPALLARADEVIE